MIFKLLITTLSFVLSASQFTRAAQEESLFLIRLSSDTPREWEVCLARNSTPQGLTWAGFSGLRSPNQPLEKFYKEMLEDFKPQVEEVSQIENTPLFVITQGNFVVYSTNYRWVRLQFLHDADKRALRNFEGTPIDPKLIMDLREKKTWNFLAQYLNNFKDFAHLKESILPLTTDDTTKELLTNLNDDFTALVHKIR